MKYWQLNKRHSYWIYISQNINEKKKIEETMGLYWKNSCLTTDEKQT